MSLAALFIETLSSSSVGDSVQAVSISDVSTEKIRQLLESAIKNNPATPNSGSSQGTSRALPEEVTISRDSGEIQTPEPDRNPNLNGTIYWAQTAQEAAALRESKDAAKTASLPAGRRLELAQQMLAQVVKPAFSRDRSAKVTPAGRKAIASYRPPIPYDSDEIAQAKAWKNEAPWTVDVLEWCIEALDPKSVEANWHLVLPPVLSLIDDIDTLWRVRGCHLLQMLLGFVPGTLLARTGMGEVLEQALVPYLMHLPPLTEEAEALELLAAVYPALSALIATRFPQLFADAKHTVTKNKALDRIMREGILRGLGQVNDSVPLSVFLLQQLCAFIGCMQIHCVKHLKFIIPMFEARLSGPFATASAELLHQTIVSLKAVQINAWPRIPFYRMQVLLVLGVAWCRVDNDKPNDTVYDPAKKEIIENIRMLRAILAQRGEGVDECRRVLENDARLVPLLDAWNDTEP